MTRNHVGSSICIRFKLNFPFSSFGFQNATLISFICISFKISLQNKCKWILKEQYYDGFSVNDSKTYGWYSLGISQRVAVCLYAKECYHGSKRSGKRGIHGEDNIAYPFHGSDPLSCYTEVSRHHTWPPQVRTRSLYRTELGQYGAALIPGHRIQD